jgi:hypothetical protein
MTCEKMLVSRAQFTVTLFAAAAFAATTISAKSQQFELSDTAFLASSTSSKLVALDTSTDSISGAVSLPSPPRQILVLYNEKLLISVGIDEKTITIVNLESGENQTIQFHSAIQSVHVNRSQDFLALGRLEGRVLLVNARTGQRMGEIVAARANSAIFTNDSKYLYLSDRERDVVSLIDVEQRRVVKEIHVFPPNKAGLSGILSFTRTPGGSFGFAWPYQGHFAGLVDLRILKNIGGVALPAGVKTGISSGDGVFTIAHSKTISLISMANRKEVARLNGTATMSDVVTGWFETTAFISNKGEK